MSSDSPRTPRVGIWESVDGSKTGLISTEGSANGWWTAWAQNLWVFDKDSLQYLGLNWETTSDSRIGPKGTVISEESVLQQAYVDQVGVRPAQ